MFRTFQILPAPLSSVLTVLFFNDPVRLSIVYMTNSPLAPRDRILANFPPITLCSLAVQIFKARVPLPSSTKKKPLSVSVLRLFPLSLQSRPKRSLQLPSDLLRLPPIIPPLTPFHICRSLSAFFRSRDIYVLFPPHVNVT